MATQAVPAKSLEKPEEDLDKLLESMNIKLVSFSQICLHTGRAVSTCKEISI